MKKQKKHIKLKTFLVIFLLHQFCFSFSSAETESISNFDPYRVEITYSYHEICPQKLVFNSSLQHIINREVFWEVPSRIHSKGLNGINRLSKFLLIHNPNISIERVNLLAKLYVEESKFESINHDIAFAQMCLETGFLKFGGSVQESQNNFCGLGAVNSNSQGDSFKTTKEGIRAHIQHLKAYSCNKPLSKRLVDKRFRYVERGSAPTIDDLAGKWAMDRNYAKKILNLLDRLYSDELI